MAFFRIGDMEHLPYEDASFDAVTNINCIMYADDPARAIHEANRVLSPDGRLTMAVWSDPRGCQFRHVMEALRGVLPSPPPGDGPLTLSESGPLEAVMEADGLEPIESREVPTPFIFTDQTQYQQAMFGTGPGQGVRRQLGEEVMTEALLDVGEQFVQDDGAYHLENTFRVVAAIRSEH